jgi:hypothetical protein
MMLSSTPLSLSNPRAMPLISGSKTEPQPNWNTLSNTGVNSFGSMPG